MKELNGKVALGVLCAILGLTISMQFKAVKGNAGGFLSSQKAQQLALELKELRVEKSSLTEELTQLEKRLKEYEMSEADESFIIKNLKKDLEKYQVVSGYKTIEGPGIVVTIDDPIQDHPGHGESSFIMYNYDILLGVINKLNGAGAEAISINDQRYTSTTEIYYTSNSVLVNSVPTLPPFTIKVVGDAESLYAALNMRFGIIEEMRELYKLQVNIKKENNVVIPRYNKTTNFKYAKPIDATS
ncbi:DUF881 domain-containing protein [Alkaliphilus sp. MSJ-5]|uniref:DUF881 domain-containing protein n=1 Tax=Alkaliphilus flagellatus TaxID=2841507 RepID=A0ABS6G545_9FIRM|nr:DUF881 domain-containing protein [Alkaliphilus flagellatus]MBU5677299.1 DUF881 domain-containing protein [Alkaliphilus flagellatus]